MVNQLHGIFLLWNKREYKNRIISSNKKKKITVILKEAKEIFRGEPNYQRNSETSDENA